MGYGDWIKFVERDVLLLSVRNSHLR